MINPNGGVDYSIELCELNNDDDDDADESTAATMNVKKAINR